MKTIKYILFITLFISFVSCSNEKQSGSNNNQASYKAPDSFLLGLDGKGHHISDYKGKPIIVNFWATWCPPCRKELPSMNRAWEMVEEEGVMMLSINMAEKTQTIKPFLKDNPIDYTILLDPDAKIAESWGVQGLPTTFIVDPEGNIIKKVVGGREWDDEKVLDEVRALRTAL